MRLVNSDNPDLYKWQIEVSYPMRSPIAETFSPEKSNRVEAEQASLRVLRKLKKQNLLPKMEQAIAEMIEIGTLVELTPEELQALPSTPHHYTKLNFVTSQTSESTSFRVINDTYTRSAGVNYSIEGRTFTSTIGDAFGAAVHHRLFSHAASLDVSRAYRRLLVSPADQMLRLLIWFVDPSDESKGFRIYKRRTADFGDPAAALALYCALVKYVAPHATLESAKIMINTKGRRFLTVKAYYR